ncbi:MAG: tryptophan synthase subunit alpha, partial [Halobacteriovoraceae bacterium]|nr:tryptophan synthase subunit alpha [Halobacteriovoraceae bacterium]
LFCDQLPLVYLASPTTPLDRVEQLASQTGPFLYYISRCGVTGAQAQLPPQLLADLVQVRQRVKAPLYVGFGIHCGEQIELLRPYCDGVIVGSALVKLQGDLEAFSHLLKQLHISSVEQSCL